MPNAKILSEKQAIVAELTEKLKGASAGVRTDGDGAVMLDSIEGKFVGIRRREADVRDDLNPAIRPPMSQCVRHIFQPALHNEWHIAIQAEIGRDDATEALQNAKILSRIVPNAHEFRVVLVKDHPSIILATVQRFGKRDDLFRDQMTGVQHGKFELPIVCCIAHQKRAEHISFVQNFPI